jgi:hypothetical protein
MTMTKNLNQLVYQPDADHMPHDLLSCEVFQSLDNGRQRYPDVPFDAWLTLRLGDVENASVLDGGDGVSQTTIEQLFAAYDRYCEARTEIDEVPMSLEDFMILEANA